MSPDSVDEKPPALSVEIPTKTYPQSSIDSSVTPSPTGILDGQSSRTSSSSLPVQHGVTFAPLPKLAPRKRRSAVPLGIASRGELMRQRRGYINSTPSYQTANPMWTDAEIAAQYERIRMTAEERRRREEDLEAGEDPFVMLGKMVKVAGKHIWRKVSQKDLSNQKAKAKDEPGGDSELKPEEGNEGGGDEDIESPPPVTGGTSPTDEPRRILATIHSNGESGQMGHHEDDQFSDVGQTETIVEGHTKYSWVELKQSTSPQG